MDEILASIRRIIESSDEKPGAFISSNAARSAVAGRQPLARDAGAERLSQIDLPTPAARVVPFSERAPFAPPPQAALHESDERWMPLTEPANQPDLPAARTASVDAEPVEAVASTDRWTQEFDDVESWTVLDTPPDSASEAVGTKTDDAQDVSAEPDVLSDATSPIEALQSSPSAEVADTVELSSVNASEPTALADDERGDAEPQPVGDAQEQVEADASASTLGSFETSAAASDASTVEAEDDFPVDFDEADFVEALDRNTAFLAASAEQSVASVSSAEPQLEVDSADLGVVEHAPARPFLRQRSPAEERSAIFGSPASASVPEPAVQAPSVMQETSALMSDQAGAEVAAAFDDLARAIRDGQMKSMEEMAREMLRPMLQDWLDDNLPRLVERLVRDEIERVSRGVRN